MTLNLFGRITILATIVTTVGISAVLISYLGARIDVPLFLQDTGNLQSVLAAVAIIVSVVVYMHEQSRLRQQTIYRSCEAILKEINENERVLRGGIYERVSYDIMNNPPEESNSEDLQFVDYTNAYLDMDAYQSIVFSGSFTHLSADTQHELTMMYSRIRSHNEVITYTDHFEDMFFMNSKSTSTERKDKWFEQIRKYDLLLTRYEKEILQYLDEVKPLLEVEKKGTKNAFFH